MADLKKGLDPDTGMTLDVLVTGQKPVESQHRCEIHPDEDDSTEDWDPGFSITRRGVHLSPMALLIILGGAYFIISALMGRHP